MWQLLTWNDTVVFEVPEDVQPGSLPTYIVLHTFRCLNFSCRLLHQLRGNSVRCCESTLMRIACCCWLQGRKL